MTGYGLGLFPQHQALLAASGVPVEVARSRGYVSADSKIRLADLGFADYQRNVPGLVVPLWSTTGELAGHQYRPDQPRAGKDGRVVKYESVPGSVPVLDVPPGARSWLRDRSPLWITEGSRKADALVGVGLPAISLAGVAAWLHDGMALGDWRDVLLRGRVVVICFDSDVMTKKSVRGQLDALAGYLTAKGATVHRCYLPSAESGKVGVDDFIGAGAKAADLAALVIDEPAPRPSPLTRTGTLPTFPTHTLPAWLETLPG